MGVVLPLSSILQRSASPDYCRAMNILHQSNRSAKQSNFLFFGATGGDRRPTGSDRPVTDRRRPTAGDRRLTGCEDGLGFVKLSLDFDFGFGFENWKS